MRGSTPHGVDSQHWYACVYYTRHEVAGLNLHVERRDARQHVGTVQSRQNCRYQNDEPYDLPQHLSAFLDFNVNFLNYSLDDPWQFTRTLMCHLRVKRSDVWDSALSLSKKLTYKPITLREKKTKVFEHPSNHYHHHHHRKIYGPLVHLVLW